jgi:hypothetical protein
MRKFIILFIFLLFYSQAEAKDYCVEFPSGTPIECYTPTNLPASSGGYLNFTTNETQDITWPHNFTLYNLSVNDNAYSATTWDGSNKTATQNSIRDKIESLAGGHDAATGSNTTDINITVTGQDFNATINPTLKQTWNEKGTSNFTGASLNASNLTNKDNFVALTTNTSGNYVATVAGTANQIIVAGADAEGATKTLSLPQSINTTSSPQFVNVTVNADAYGAGWNGNQNASPKDGVYDQMELKLAITGTGGALTAVANVTNNRHGFTYTITNGTSVITSGWAGFTTIANSFTLTRTMFQSMDFTKANATIVVKRCPATATGILNLTEANFTTAGNFTINGSTMNTDTTLTGWTTAWTAGDLIGFNITETNFKQIQLSGNNTGI